MAHYALALDVGGTFTDVMLMHRASGRLWTVKTPSTPADPSQGFFQGIQRMLLLAGIASEAVGHILHGSTVATNTILEGKGASTGMITTEGFKYVLEIGRHDIPRRANLYAWVKPVRPVPPRRILEVRERVLLDGTVATPLDEAGCREVVRRLGALGVEAVAVVFLYAYANPVHEQRAAAIVQDEAPQVQVCLSSDVLPVFREYERAMATVLNAYVQPVVGRYIGKLENGLRTRGLQGPLLIMASNGGVFGPQTAARQAVHMALSGPAAGAIGASYVGRLAGYPDVISIDMGGTSADICLIQEGRPAVTHEGEIGPFPLQIPMTDIHTIGAGGGSIAAVTALGSLTVGPQSAGAMPGPACYDQGGTAPTVTDANLVLGRIPPALLGGEVPLNVERARQAIYDHVAMPLHLDLYEAAAGIVQIVNHNMVGALRVVKVTTLAAFEQIIQQSTAAVRQAFAARVPDGVYSFRDYLDSDGITDQSYSVHLSLVKQNGTISLDFSGTDNQARGAVNFIMHESVPKFMYGLYLTADDPTILLNHGFARAIDAVQTRPGSLVNPIPPAPLGMRSNTMLRVNNCVFGTLALATDGQTNAASSVYVIYMLRSLNRQSGDYTLCIEGLGVGFGARPFSDGPDAIYYVAQKNYPVEFAEMEFGVRIERYSIHRDSGGPGQYRGGCGIVRDVRIIADAGLLASRLENVRFPAWGVNGGHSGRPGRIVVNPDTPEEHELKPLSDNNRLRQGDLLRVMTSGGGGWGHPFDRPAAKVREDVLDGFVSSESALTDYGVVLDSQRLEVDEVETAQLRKDRRSETTMFHRGRYLHGEER